MRFYTRIAELSLADLQALAAGRGDFPLSDADFLETLAARGCFLVPPWVVKGSLAGGLARVTPLLYDEAGNIDKVRVLIHVAREFRAQRRRRPDFGPRFSAEL